MLNPIDTSKKPEGGGLFGKILNGVTTVGGAIVGGVAGGPMGAVQGASVGNMVGSTAGGLLDPGKAGSGQRGPALSNIAAQDPEVTFQKFRDAQKELVKDSMFTPEEKDTLHGILENGKLQMKKQMGVP